MVDVWNTHRIRATAGSRGPAGRPIMLFTIPEVYGAAECCCIIDENDLDACIDECHFVDSELPCSEEIFNLAKLYMEENNWIDGHDAYSAANLYVQLRNAIIADI